MNYDLVAEGNANRILRRPDGTLIRVSKTGVDPEYLVKFWNEFWVPKLGSYLGTFQSIDDPVHGPAVLIDEIGNVQARRKIVAQFKPKWLVQSPRAPTNARSCRTCAIKAMRGQPNKWCSLDLAAKRDTSIRTLATYISEPGFSGPVYRVLQTSSVLEDILYWQNQLLDNLEACMSLRDCTIMIEYVQTGKNADEDAINNINNYKVWIVDLDPKGGERKHEYWENIETDLEPYYLQHSEVCRLSRSMDGRKEN